MLVYRLKPFFISRARPAWIRSSRIPGGLIYNVWLVVQSHAVSTYPGRAIFLIALLHMSEQPG